MIAGSGDGWTRLAKRLGRRRREMNMTAGELAIRAGVSRNTVANLEAGEHQVSVGNFEKIAQALGLELALAPVRRRSMVRATIVMDDGKAIKRDFKDFDELSEWQTEHHGQIRGISAKYVEAGVRKEEALVKHDDILDKRPPAWRE